MKLEELCAAVQEARYYNERFTRREYTSAFRTYTERFGPLYMAAVRETAEDPDGRRVLAEQLLDLLEAGWKRQRAWNRTMVRPGKADAGDVSFPMLLGLEAPVPKLAGGCGTAGTPAGPRTSTTSPPMPGYRRASAM